MAQIGWHTKMFINLKLANLKIRPWHDVWAIAHACAITHTNQEKGSLGG